MMAITVTVALIRLGFLVLWAFVAMFEENLRKLLWYLVFALAAGNLFAIGVAYFMEIPGG